MSAEVLRRAAAQIRNDYGGIVSQDGRDGRRWLSVADWLEATADHADSSGGHCVCGDAALTVARVYLRETS